jgi:hypothetical protein
MADSILLIPWGFPRPAKYQAKKVPLDRNLPNLKEFTSRNLESWDLIIDRAGGGFAVYRGSPSGEREVTKVLVCCKQSTYDGVVKVNMQLLHIAVFASCCKHVPYLT